MRTGRRRSKGMVLVLVALLCLVLLPLLGLAIDGAVVYLLRAKLSRAVDAAVLASARGLSRGADIDSQRANAIAVAQRYFDANFKAGEWGTRNASRGVTVVEDNVARARVVTMTASLDAPLYFMPALNHETAQISVTAQSRRRDVNVVLVLDRSGSMVNGHAIPTLKEDAKDFVNEFAGGRDKVGLITYGGNYYPAYSPSVGFKTDSPGVLGSIDQIVGGGNTGTAQALWVAYRELQTLNEVGALNAIVIFTDGLPNGITADFQPFLSATSGCKYTATEKKGYLAQASGPPWGVVDPLAVSMSDVAETRGVPGSDGCVWNNNPTKVKNAITRIPAIDAYGNSTDNGYRPVDLARIDASQITAASFNAADDAARRIRSDGALRPAIYAIGLGGTSSSPPDQSFMRRIANDPSSPAFNNSQPAGLYVWSPTKEQLHGAFLRIASEILRLAQ